MAHDGLMTIGEFSRLVGVTPSALRYYDDCGLLVPAHTSATTGYRFYARDQRDRGLVIRMLREAGLSLAEVRRVVDGPAGDVRTVVREHVVRNAEQTAKAAATLRRALRVMLGSGPPHPQVSVSGPELASGIRQVCHAVDRPQSATADLSHMQIEIDVDEVRLVATDRYRLALRSLRGHGFEGAAAQVGVGADDVLRLVPALLLADQVILVVDRAGPTCVVGDQRHVLTARSGGFPDYRGVLDGMSPPDARLVVDRVGLVAALRAAGPDRVVALSAADGGVPVVTRPPDDRAQPITGRWVGRRFQVAFAAAHLVEALAVSVGPDVIVDLADGPRPAVIRSADHGGFTTLVMPRAHPDRAPEPAGMNRRE